MRRRDLRWLLAACVLTCCAQLGGFEDFSAPSGGAGAGGTAASSGAAGTAGGGGRGGAGAGAAGGDAGGAAGEGNPGAGQAGTPAAAGHGGGGEAGSAGAAGNRGLLDDCVLLMHFEESSWSTTPGAVIDSSGQGNHGTATESTIVPVSDGKIGQAASFDGTGWIAVPDAPSLRPTDQLSYAAWIYPEGLGNVADYSPGIITKRNGYASDVSYTLFLWNWSGSSNVTESYFYVDLANTRFGGNTAVAAETWTHVAVVFDGNLSDGRTKLYVNGALEVEDDTAPASIPAYTADLLIGNLLNSGTAPFEGKIDEAVVWTRALSDDEVAEVHAATAPL